MLLLLFNKLQANIPLLSQNVIHQHYHSPVGISSLYMHKPFSVINITLD